MRLFLREHALLICVHFIQYVVILAIFWLDGYPRVLPALYAIFLGLFFLGGYLIYHYVTRRHFYKRLENPVDSPGEALETTDDAPASQALAELLKSQYLHYHNAQQNAQQEQDSHLRYIEQWVHQMKTPLSVIELTAQQLDEPESSNLREETERMKTGLNMVLYMARLRTIEDDFHVAPVSLETIVHEVNQENKRLFIRNGVFPRLNMQRQHLTVESDEKWLRFIITQLVQNAVKYSSGHGKEVVFTFAERDGEAVLSITDKGVGIPVQDHKRIFRPFFTGENGRHFRESTGMGLYLAKEATDYLHHRLEFESSLGEGTTFRIVFTETQNLTKV
ncbi:HAMP domain-containing histidine kinase [Bacillaceae bacterium SIJ1]|uniref:sensor histidine kinase n=1 Tax=Litoribacterium kuwaitense TaxID=1398745 RepID=UPI0013ED3189|nr:sensor histidine kinase [Litoribacterium kuwaitense]NGP46118.1 HAMP domain-containing histidine kinase [Litoribacterium kuwaitense]